MPRSPCSILHLTDIHLGATERKGYYWNSEATELHLPEHDRRGLLGSLLRDLKQQKIKPDLVIVTGDLLDRCGPEGVPMALDLFAALCDRLNLSRRRLLMIPGNHDVSRSADPNARYASFDAICNAFYGENLTGHGPGTPAHQRVAFYDFSDELGVEVVGFNSCEALDVAARNEHGSIGTAQRDRAEELLEGSKNDGAVRIAAMHHHLASPAGIVRDDYSVMDDAQLVLHWLARNRFHLALHGHQHVDWQEVRELDGWSVAITAGGSAGVAGYGRKEWDLRLGYQVLVLEGPSGGRRIRREYDPQTREWMPAGRGAAEQPFRFGATLSTNTSTNTSSPSKADLRERAIELVTQARWEPRSLVQAYTCCAQGERRRDFDGERGDDLAARMLRALFTMVPHLDGTIPWLLFFWHLVEIASSARAAPELNRLTVPLSDHFDKVTSSLGFSRVIVSDWKRRVAADRDRLETLELHAVIVVQERSAGYFVRAFRVLVPRGAETWTDEDVSPLEIPGGDDREVRDAAELAGLVKELLLDLDDDFARAEDSTIELFVPVDLLGCDVDQWLVEGGFGASRIGHEYKVVVRSWERVYRPGWGGRMQKWKPRWDRLVEARTGSVWRSGPEHVRGQSLAWPDDHPACVVMSVAPPGKTALVDIVSGGSAVAVWPRKTVSRAAELSSFLTNRMVEERVSSFREEVRAFRKIAASYDEPENHPGSHLTLLWDDPNKLPPDAPARGHRLRAPTKTRGPVR